MNLNILQKVELFHLAFLRILVQKIPVSSFSVKGGCNLRFFFGSERYSEDIDIDVSGVAVHVLKDQVMSIFKSAGMIDTLRTFGIDEIRPPALAHAKQTETVQRFKAHLATSAGEDIATKIEFSRRGLDAPIRAEPILLNVLASYRMAPLIVPHYTAAAAVRQKVQALVTRRQPEARDVFDLYVLSSHAEAQKLQLSRLASTDDLHQALERVDSIEYEQYRDTVVGFLPPEEQERYDDGLMWDRIRLVVIGMIEKGIGDGD
jgi:predicted nucleotidyltransferase component of viral defense system